MASSIFATRPSNLPRSASTKQHDLLLACIRILHVVFNLCLVYCLLGLECLRNGILRDVHVLAHKHIKLLYAIMCQLVHRMGYLLCNHLNLTRE